jgi:hypothetical protein
LAIEKQFDVIATLKTWGITYGDIIQPCVYCCEDPVWVSLAFGDEYGRCSNEAAGESENDAGEKLHIYQRNLRFLARSDSIEGEICCYK